MKIGYARVSTDGQNLDLQRCALSAAGCERIFEDHGFSATRVTRPGLKAALRCLRRGDTLVVWRFDRLARSVPHLSSIISGLQKRGVGFASVTEAIDTSSEIGELILWVLGAVAGFERCLIKSRIAAGLDAARARGQQLGRRPSLSAEQRAEVKELLASQSVTAGELAERYHVHPRTIRRCLVKDAVRT
ncbi:recombinase family protein [Rhizobium leguminosarum]|uniref:recombinase family protein n=1 Tax=Rhizobium leguminosarum TaxID=384 RepID=UPI001C95CC13|nr:recombinase family protein [Rhizobium leguminosarum]MBY5635917.1 recombinase family protein [Rhizobium leguminosarum]